MWIRRVGIDRDPRPALDVESLPRPARPRELLQLSLRRRPVLAHPPGRLLRHRLEVAADQLGGACLRGELFRRERALQLRDEVRAGDDLRSHRPHQLERPSVHARNRGDLVARRVVHRHPADAAQERTELAVPRPPRCVRGGAARYAIERARLDRMEELARWSLRRDEAVPAAGARAGGIQPEQAIGDLVGAAEVEEQPAVELVALQRTLDARHPLRREALIGRRRSGRSRSCHPGVRRRAIGRLWRGKLRERRAQQGPDHGPPR